jgi:hypothetical protein
MKNIRKLLASMVRFIALMMMKISCKILKESCVCVTKTAKGALKVGGETITRMKD